MGVGKVIIHGGGGVTLWLFYICSISGLDILYLHHCPSLLWHGGIKHMLFLYVAIMI